MIAVRCMQKVGGDNPRPAVKWYDDTIRSRYSRTFGGDVHTSEIIHFNHYGWWRQGGQEARPHTWGKRLDPASPPHKLREACWPGAGELTLAFALFPRSASPFQHLTNASRAKGWSAFQQRGRMLIPGKQRGGNSATHLSPPPTPISRLSVTNGNRCVCFCYLLVWRCARSRWITEWRETCNFMLLRDIKAWR